MKIPLVCRSCGEIESVDFAATADKVICSSCEHEAPAGNAALRQSITARHAKTRLLCWIGGGSAVLALLLIGIQIFPEEAGLGDALWVAAGIFFLGASACAILSEREREVVYF